MAYDILNNKGQLNLGFVVSVVLLIMLILFVMTNVLNMIPSIRDRTEQTTLEINALSLSKMLIETPGYPYDWTSNPARLGLAQYNNYSHKTIIGKLDPSKVNYANNTALYSVFKTNLGIENSLNFHLIIRNSTSVVLDLYNTTPSKTSNVVSLRKFAVINQTPVNITLLIWR